MRNVPSKLALSAALVLAMSLTFSCSSGGGSPDPKKTVRKEKISGVSQKGSFVAGSKVKLYELDENYERTKKVFNGEVGSAGMYEITEIKGYELASPYVDVEVTGKYVKEIDNATSTEIITLKAIADVSDKDKVNINVFTHLEHDKVLLLVKQGSSFAEAKSKAFAKVLTSLGIGLVSGNSEDMSLQADSVLLLASVLLQVDRSESDLKTLLKTLNGIEAVKSRMERAQEVFATAKNNVQGSTPSSPSSSSVVPVSSSSEILSSSSITPSSSSIVPSSSSLEVSSSSITIISGTFIDERDNNKEYKWVEIGTQTWMAENLNYRAAGSRCYDDNVANCDRYGRLYDITITLDGSPVSEANPSGVQGICPWGWHVPSAAEWDVLKTTVGDVAGTKLKATSGWKEDGNGTDIYGFSALPGGEYSGGYDGIGEYSDWLCSDRSGMISFRGMAYNKSNIVSYSGSNRSMSLRCVKDLPGDTKPKMVVKKGTFKDDRDGKDYGWTEIGEQVWMTKNLNYDPKTNNGSKCYDDNVDNCDIYGRLYDITTVLNGSPVSSENPSGVQGICPSGWHVPSAAEWDVLKTTVGSDVAGTKLKATSGWKDHIYGNGTDIYGFAALPSGQYSEGIEEYGDWWCSDRSGMVSFRRIAYNNGNIASVSGGGTGRFMALRCVKD